MTQPCSERDSFRRDNRGRCAFTFIEVLACLLILGTGIAAAIGMVMYGVLLGNRAQGMSTGLATAMTVAVDPQPMGVTWLSGPANGTAKGYINGFYVERTESTDTALGEPGSRPLPPGFTSCVVTVDVYDTFKGRPVSAFSTRYLRQIPQ